MPITIRQITCVALAFALTELHVPNMRADEAILEATKSPNGKYVVVELQTKTGFKYDFVDTTSRKKVGRIMPLSNKDDPIKASFVVSWCPDSSKVCVLIYYGTRSSQISIFAQCKNKDFVRLDFHHPEPRQLYKFGKPDDTDSPESSENALGPWIDNKSAKIVLGVIQGVDDDAKHYLVTLKVLIENCKPRFTDVKKLGAMTPEDAEKFFDGWGNNFK